MIAEKEVEFSLQKNRCSVPTLIMMVIMIFVCGGIFGFVYEELFYRIDLGYFVKRGTTFGPWIPIYGFGALLILLFTYKLRKRWWMVFLIGGIVCGVIEFVTGYILYNFGNTRLWDYNNEIWNWGNIGGYICFRSVLFFALSSLFLIYGLTPFVIYTERKLPKKGFITLSIIPGLLFLADLIVSGIKRFL